MSFKKFRLIITCGSKSLTVTDWIATKKTSVLKPWGDETTRIRDQTSIQIHGAQARTEVFLYT